MVVLAVPQLAIGIWAMVAPHHWYENFPGVHPHLISAEPPYNAHLATDAGIGFFATGVGLVLAAALGAVDRVSTSRSVTFLAFAVPHTLYHALHEAPGLTGSRGRERACSSSCRPSSSLRVLVVGCRTT